jgi:hypothetical protein
VADVSRDPSLPAGDVPTLIIDRQRAGAGRKSLVLAVVLAGSFLAVLDVAIVNVAIPSLREDLNVGFGAVALVISVYSKRSSSPSEAIATSGRC